MRFLLLVPLLVVGCSAPARAAPTPNVSATVNAAVRASVTALAPTPAPTSDRPTIGENGWIYAKKQDGTTAERVPVSGNPSDSIAYRKAVDANDAIGVEDLFRSGRFVQMPVRTRVLVLDLDRSGRVDLAHVRFAEGTYSGTTGWLEHSWIVRALPN